MSLRSGEHGKSFVNLLLEVVLITVGVFLALWANNWHEDREHRAQARAALRNFVGEMEANRQATQSNRSYHETLARELDHLILYQTGFSLRHLQSLHPAECLSDLRKQLPRFCVHPGEHVEGQPERFGYGHDVLSH